MKHNYVLLELNEAIELNNVTEKTTAKEADKNWDKIN